VTQPSTATGIGANSNAAESNVERDETLEAPNINGRAPLPTAPPRTRKGVRSCHGRAYVQAARFLRSEHGHKTGRPLSSCVRWHRRVPVDRLSP
jgi:hypothetical protein